MNWKDKFVCVAIPCSWPFMPREFVISFFSLEVTSKNHVVFSRSFPLDYCRNDLVKSALRLNAEYILFLDTDMAIPRDTVKKLIEADRDIIGARCFGHGVPFLPRTFKEVGGKEQIKCVYHKNRGVFEVDYIGTACLLVKMEVFKNITFPYFRFAPPGSGERLTGEDFYFCDKAKKAGYKVYVHTNTNVGHLTYLPIRENHFVENYTKFVGEPKEEELISKDVSRGIVDKLINKQKGVR